jgi:hypothetical protein
MASCVEEGIPTSVNTLRSRMVTVSFLFCFPPGAVTTPTIQSPRRPGLLRDQRTGPFHTPIIANTDDAIIGKINAGILD